MYISIYIRIYIYIYICVILIVSYCTEHMGYMVQISHFQTKLERSQKSEASPGLRGTSPISQQHPWHPQQLASQVGCTPNGAD